MLSLKSIINGVSKESPTILTGFAVTGVFTTTILTVSATKEALVLIEAEAYKNKMQVEDFEPIDIVKIAWKPYIYAAISAGLTIGCIVTANTIHLKRAAAMAGLYSLAETALLDYQKNVVKVIGAKKEQKVRDEVAQTQLDKNPIKEENVYATGHGGHLIYDPISGRYFRSDIEHIRQKINDFNEELFSDMYLPLNDFYYLLGLKPIELGTSAGWDVDEGKLQVRFSSKIAENGEPCIVMDYSSLPKKL